MSVANLPTGVGLSRSPRQGRTAAAFSLDGFLRGRLEALSSCRPVGLAATDLARSARLPRTTVSQQVYTIEQMANDAVALLDHLNISAAHLLGHSMGGRVALTVALNFPGRVKSLIMAASGSGLVTRPI